MVYVCSGGVRVCVGVPRHMGHVCGGQRGHLSFFLSVVPGTGLRLSGSKRLYLLRYPAGPSSIF